jgi:hypothetical protein
MKILLDMNLSPRWVETLQAEGWETLHWSQVGDPRASDDVIVGWARQHGFVVFTYPTFTRWYCLRPLRSTMNCPSMLSFSVRRRPTSGHWMLLT